MGDRSPGKRYVDALPIAMAAVSLGAGDGPGAVANDSNGRGHAGSRAGRGAGLSTKPSAQVKCHDPTALQERSSVDTGTAALLGYSPFRCGRACLMDRAIRKGRRGPGLANTGTWGDAM